MVLHIFAYNLHLKVSHAVCSNHFNQVPLTVNIVNKHTKYLGSVGISVQKTMGACSLLKQSWEIWFSCLAPQVWWGLYHKQVMKRSSKIRVPALARTYVCQTLSNRSNAHQNRPQSLCVYGLPQVHRQSGCSDVAIRFWDFSLVPVW